MSPAIPVRSSEAQGRRQFLREWLRDPLRVAAVAPSSSSLASLITSEVVVSTGPVIELGPGTGAFTRALIRRGVAEDDLALVESGEVFADGLSAEFPRAELYRTKAQNLLALSPLGGRMAGAIISGLPLISMTQSAVTAVLIGAFQKLRPDGAFYQFTYMPFAPIRRAVLGFLGLRAQRMGATFWNLPPASVYRISRDPGREAIAEGAALIAPPMSVAGRASAYFGRS